MTGTYVRVKVIKVADLRQGDIVWVGSYQRSSTMILDENPVHSRWCYVLWLFTNKVGKAGFLDHDFSAPINADRTVVWRFVP